MKQLDSFRMGPVSALGLMHNLMQVLRGEHLQARLQQEIRFTSQLGQAVGQGAREPVAYPMHRAELLASDVRRLGMARGNLSYLDFCGVLVSGSSLPGPPPPPPLLPSFRSCHGPHFVLRLSRSHLHFLCIPGLCPGPPPPPPPPNTSPAGPPSCWVCVGGTDQIPSRSHDR